MRRRRRPRFGLLLERQVVPFGAADRAEQDRVGGLRLGHRVVADRGAFTVDRGAADQAQVDVEIGAGLVGAGVQPFDDIADFAHDFGADAVARQEQ